MRIILFTILCLSTSVWAADEDSQQWLTVNAQGFSESHANWGAYAEFQTRRSDDQQQIYETVFRPALIYKTNSLGLFYAGFLIRYDRAGEHNETRYWLQWSQSQPFESLRLAWRLRLEQRDLDGLSDASQRLRGQVRLQSLKPVAHVLPFASTELFYHLNSASADLSAGLKQTRTAVGVTYAVTEKLNADLFYMQVSVDQTTRTDQLLHVAGLQLAYSF